MNIETIRKYRKEFEAWLNGDAIEYRLDHENAYWFDLPPDATSAWTNEAIAYRIKAKTRMIGDVECPLPLTSLFEGETVYIASPTNYGLYEYTTATNTPMGKLSKSNGLLRTMLERGLCFSLDVDAIATAEALLKLTAIKSDEAPTQTAPVKLIKYKQIRLKSKYNGVIGYTTKRGKTYRGEVMIKTVTHSSKPFSGSNGEWFAATAYDKFVIKYGGKRDRLNFNINTYDVESIKNNDAI